MIRQALAATGLTLIAGIAVAGAPSSFSESNGLKNCVNAAAQDARYLRVQSTYFINQTEDGRTYYINGVGQTAAGAGHVRIACETTVNGRRVLAVSVDSGRYAPRNAPGADLAAK